MLRKDKGLCLATLIGVITLAGCGAQPTVTNTNTVNSNVNTANTAVNTNTAANTETATVAAREPDQYEATVTVKVEAVGQNQKSAMPTLAANVARSGNDRRMEFTMPAGGRVVFLDKGGMNYLILPDRKQYAELDKDALGFEVRRLLMPEQIVEHAKAVPGMTFVGEEQHNGRTVLKYQYGAVTDTQTQAGQVSTESFLLVDKETGLPLRSETQSQTTSGGNVQGFSGVRVITEIADIKEVPDTALFEAPTGLQKVESSQVKAQVDMIFNAIASFAAQMMRQNQPSQPAASPTVSPMR